MREFKKYRSSRADIVRVSLGVGGVLILGGVAFGAMQASWNMYGRFSEAAAARAQSEQQLMELQERHMQIAADVESLGSVRGLETEVRERYGYVRPGEGQISIVRHASSSEMLRQEAGFWEKMRQTLFVW